MEGKRSSVKTAVWVSRDQFAVLDITNQVCNVMCYIVCLCVCVFVCVCVCHVNICGCVHVYIFV